MTTTIPIVAPGAGPDRYALKREPISGPIRYARVWYHGGGQGVGGSTRMEGRIRPETGTLDYFGEGTPHPDREGKLTTGWIRPDGPDPGMPGLTVLTDVNYTNALLERVRHDVPGIPIYVAGYSSGGAFFTSCIHNGSLSLQGVQGWAVLKNTPIFDWLSSEASIPERELLVTGTLPPKMAYWYATGDTEASQDHAEGHTTFEEAGECFENTYPDSPRRLVSYACGRRRTRIDTEQGTTFMLAVERGGSHSSSWGCVGSLIHGYLTGAL